MDTSDLTKTIRVKPWGKDQGDFVEINADDFDAAIHTEFSVGPSAAKAPDPAGKSSRKGKRKA